MSVYGTNAATTGQSEKKEKSGVRGLLAVIAVLQCVILLVLLVSSALVVPKLISVADSVQTLTTELNTTMEQNDLSEMLSEIQELVEASSNGVADATEKIDAIDIETLNKAISDLSSIISPLASLFNR